MLDKINLSDRWLAYTLKREMFQKQINEELHNRHPYLYGASRWVEIVYHRPPDTYYKKVINKVIKELQKRGYVIDSNSYANRVVDKSKIALNGMVCDALDKQAKKEIAKERQRVGEKYHDGEETFYILGPDFLREFNALVDRFVRLNAV